jgi:hypothetical protein
VARVLSHSDGALPKNPSPRRRLRPKTTVTTSKRSLLVTTIFKATRKEILITRITPTTTSRTPTLRTSTT